MKVGLILLASLASLSAISATNAAPTKCPGEKGAKSANGDQPVSVRFVNDLGISIYANWLDYAGKRVEYARIRSGESWSTNTYVGHPWVFLDSGGGCIELYYPNVGDEVHTID